MTAYLGETEINIGYTIDDEGYVKTEMLEEHLNADNPHQITASIVGAPTVEEMNTAIANIEIPDVNTAIANHNTDTSAHTDIRTAINTVQQTAETASSTATSVQTALADKAPKYYYGTDDITAGSVSSEPEGSLHFVYE